MPVVVQDVDRRFDVHPVIDLLAAPNPGQSGAALLEGFYGHLLLSGDGYLEAAGTGADNGPRELYVLRSDRMKVVPGSDGWPVAYEYSVGAMKHLFDMRQDRVPVVHVKSFHPQDDHYGLSPLTAAANAIDVHNSASDLVKALLDNAARPSGAIVYRRATGGAGPDQYARLIDELEAQLPGGAQRRAAAAARGRARLEADGLLAVRHGVRRTKEAAAREIALAFGVPPMLLGLPGDNTYANYAEATGPSGG